MEMLMKVSAGSVLVMEAVDHDISSGRVIGVETYVLKREKAKS